MALAESGGSKCKEAPNEGPFRDTLGCLAGAGGRRSLAIKEMTDEPAGSCDVSSREESSPLGAETAKAGSGRSLEPGPAKPDARDRRR